MQHCTLWRMNETLDRQRRIQERDRRGSRTREALKQAALTLLRGDKRFADISLREVTREVGIVPTAFYRHFVDMEELGLALLDEAMQTLRALLREARLERGSPRSVVARTIRALVHALAQQPLYFRFIVREYHGGSGRLGEAVRGEIRRFTTELAIELARFPHLQAWNAEDLQMLAALIIKVMASAAERMLDAPTRLEDGRGGDIGRIAEKQLRLIVLGTQHWHSEG